MYPEALISDIFKIKNDHEFNECALELFRLQYEKVNVYREYCNLLKIEPSDIKTYSQIPFLPIQFFKSKKVIWDELDIKQSKLFLSSGTTATGRSHHYVHNVQIYEKSFLTTFERFYGKPEDWTIIALLPSYQEQGNSSLIYMVDRLIQLSKDEKSGYYQNVELVEKTLRQLPNGGKKVLLIGVSYALLDLLGSHKFNLPNLVVMETGGMKGRRKELTKTELHEILKSGFKVSGIHSEYGMTELLSQGYSKGDEWFELPKWMKIAIRAANDPLSLVESEEKTGGVNVIDLANVYSCAFIATQDLGRYENGKLKIMGRFDHSDTRGCNLLVQ
ncbi:MAG: acyl transferase [Flavobacteriales bacterium]|nr:acyl transferase [Flavobacteriales bacterium]MCB9195763.1 acyl transferase [Flavobacteriales bacterium]MCB9198817.1 acyl transferase [Flavobacteriales bacterium]